MYVCMFVYDGSDLCVCLCTMAVSCVFVDAIAVSCAFVDAMAVSCAFVCERWQWAMRLFVR